MHERLLTPLEAEAVARVRRGMWTYIIVSVTLRDGSPSRLWRMAIEEQLDLLYRTISKLHRAVIVACTTWPHAANDLSGAGEAVERAIDDLLPMFRKVPGAAAAEANPLTEQIDRELAHGTSGTALQFFGLRVNFGRSNDGQANITWDQLTDSEYDRAMLTSTLRQLEVLVADDPLLALERRACHWFFFRDASTPLTKKGKRALRRRERQWALADRPTVASGEPILRMTPTLERTKDYTRRQRRVMAAMAESVSGVFLVHARDGETLDVENLVGGARHALRSEGLVGRLAEGDCFHGRIIPLEDGHWLYTKSAILLDTGLVERWQLAHAAQVTASAPGERAVHIERTLAEASRDGSPLASSPAADSPHEARELLDQLREAMRIRFLLGRETLPMGGTDAASPAWPDGLRQRFDVVLGDWVAALEQIAAV